jgi:uncharacterized protein YjlB
MRHSTYLLADDGLIPNHPTLPLLVYEDALPLAGSDPAAVAEETFRRNRWGGVWRNSIYPFHHYHSTAHEMLAVVQGWATVQLGGPQGITLRAQAGTVLVLPAGRATNASMPAQTFWSWVRTHRDRPGTFAGEHRKSGRRLLPTYNRLPCQPVGLHNSVKS